MYKHKLNHLLIILVLIFFIFSSSEIFALERIRTSYSAISGAMLPIWITKEKGIFEKYGLKADLVYIRGGSTVAQAIMAGEIDLALMGGGIIEANLSGGDTVFIAGTTNVFVFSLYSLPEIKSINDLKGKRIGATRFGTATMYAVISTLQKFGIDPRKDVSLIQTGGVPETMASIKSGRVHAGVISPPTTLNARKEGLKELVNITELSIDNIQSGIGTTRTFLRKREKVSKSFMKAFVDGISVIKRDKNYSLQILQKYTKAKDREILEETYLAFIGTLPKIPYVSVKAVKNMLEQISETDPKAKNAKPEDFIDNSLVRELDESGFIDSLYK